MLVGVNTEELAKDRHSDSYILVYAIKTQYKHINTKLLYWGHKL